MRVGLVVVVLAGCFRPHPQAGAPCATNGDCPSPLECIANECRVAGTNVGDGVIDAPRPPPDMLCASNDSDCDGVPDATDNCPTVYNPDQANEDGDRFGDVCDPCPPFVDVDPVVDSDGDGVSDQCDPRPTLAGDKIILFEGFHHGVPASWTINGGAWTAGSDDDIVVDSLAATTNVSLSIAGATSKHDSVMAAVTLLATAPTPTCPGSVKVGIADDFSATLGTGVACESYLPGGGQLALAQTGAATLNAKPYTTAVNATQIYAERRDLTSFTCHGKTVGTTQDVTVQSSSPTDNANPEVALRACATKASIAWVMVVAN